MAFPFLILGLLALWAGTELLLKGVMRVVDHYGLSHVFTGLVLLAIITDLPETAIAVASSIKQLQGIEASGIIIGNAVGSSIAQISIILGISALYGYFTLTKRQLFEDGAFLLGSVIILFMVTFDGYIGFQDGVSLLIIYMLYYWMMLRREKAGTKLRKRKMPGVYMVILFILAGAFIIAFGSELAVRNAILLSERWNISQTFVGVIIVGISTSLPELAISISAALKKAPGLSVGNILGSNIYDQLVPVGLGAIIAPLRFEAEIMYIDFSFLFLISLLALMFFWKRKGLQRKEGMALIILFLAFSAFKIISS